MLEEAKNRLASGGVPDFKNEMEGVLEKIRGTPYEARLIKFWTYNGGIVEGEVPFEPFLQSFLAK